MFWVAAIPVAGGRWRQDRAPSRGLHIMFMSLKAPLGDAKQFPFTLRFETAGQVEPTVVVPGAAAMDGPPDPGD
ncbi:MAG: hypothetical protein QF827_10550 [Alphaproteobacteria bacterium]|nr:hypothetical protein [Alphaproteobacteria bacterium]